MAESLKETGIDIVKILSILGLGWVAVRWFLSGLPQAGLLDGALRIAGAGGSAALALNEASKVVRE